MEIDMKYQRRAYSRGERENMITMAFAYHIQKGGSNRLTMYSIARKIGLVPTIHIMKILKGMAVDGKLTFEVVKRSGRWDTFVWSLPDGSFTTPKKERTIEVKARGKVVAQLELWT